VLRVVLDTNVYVSAFVFGGAPLEILTLGIRGHLAVFVSAPILEELQTVLRRKFEWPTREPSEPIGGSPP
jgi:predicted nucleic acid-binding protein